MEGGGKAAYQIPRRRREEGDEDLRDCHQRDSGGSRYGSRGRGGRGYGAREDHYGGGGRGGRSGGHYSASRDEASTYERDRYGGPSFGSRQSQGSHYGGPASTRRDPRPPHDGGRSPPTGGGYQRDGRSYHDGSRAGDAGRVPRGRVRRHGNEVSQSVSVPKEYGGLVVGKHGKNLQRVEESAGVAISNGYDHPLNPGLLSFTISGTPAAIENAKLQIFYAVSGGFTRDKCEDNFLVLNTGLGPQEPVQFVPASARQVYGPADTYSLRTANDNGDEMEAMAKRIAALNLGLLKVGREDRGAAESRTAVQRVAKLLRETRGFPGKVRLVARLGQITFRAMGQLVVPANKPHPFSTMEPILRDRCTPRFVTITDETETKLARETLSQLLAEGCAPEEKEVYEFKVWDEASHIPLSLNLIKNADGRFTLKEAFMVGSKKLICDYLFPTDEPDVRICLDTQRTVEATPPLLAFVHEIRVDAAKSEGESEGTEESLTFPAPPTGDSEAKDDEEGEATTAPKQRFHAFFLRKKSDVIYRLSGDCFVRTSRVSETGFGNDERNRKWETEVEFVTAAADLEDQALDARLEAFFDAVLQVRRKLHGSS